MRHVFRRSAGHVCRLDEADRAEHLPSIPVQPIGYTDAEVILARLEGEVAPDSWQGGLNLTYLIGGRLKDGERLEILLINLDNHRYYEVF